MTVFKAFFIASLAALAAPAAAQDRAEPVYIQAGRLLADPGEGTVAREQTIVVVEGRVTEIRDGYSGEGNIVDLRDGFVLPGLIDAHVHLLHENGPGDKLDKVVKSPAQWALDGVPFAEKTLKAGFTPVANVGDDNDAIFALRDAVAAGKVAGPRILASGAVVSPHGGEGDVYGYRWDVIETIRRPTLCSGADDCRRVVREQIQRGADLIKITATGAVLSDADAGLDQQFTDEEMKAIVDTAHGLGRMVTAHAHGTAGLNAFLRAGGDAIEHGTYLDDDSVRLFKRNEGYLVPTLLAGATVTQWANDPDSWLSAPAQAKARLVGPRMVDAARRAHRAVVAIAFGTDSSVSPHGENAREFSLLAQAGLSPLDAIRAATVNAADHLRIAGEAGVIAPGVSADIIALREDPLEDVSALERVDFVMRGGRVYKD